MDTAKAGRCVGCCARELVTVGQIGIAGETSPLLHQPAELRVKLSDRPGSRFASGKESAVNCSKQGQLVGSLMALTIAWYRGSECTKSKSGSPRKKIIDATRCW